MIRDDEKAYIDFYYLFMIFYMFIIENSCFDEKKAQDLFLENLTKFIENHYKAPDKEDKLKEVEFFKMSIEDNSNRKMGFYINWYRQHPEI